MAWVSGRQRAQIPRHRRATRRQPLKWESGSFGRWNDKVSAGGMERPTFTNISRLSIPLGTGQILPGQGGQLSMLLPYVRLVHGRIRDRYLHKSMIPTNRIGRSRGMVQK